MNRLIVALLAGAALITAARADMYQDASNAVLPVARTNLGLGTMAIQNANAVAITGGTITGATITGHASLDLASANNLSDVANAATARTNLGLGTIATQNANAVAVTGGTITGTTSMNTALTSSGSSAASVYFNSLASTDTYTVTGANFGVLLNAQDNFGGSAAQGGRIGVNAGVKLTAATNAVNANHNYVGISGNCEMAAADNGTSGTPKGACFTFGGYAIADSGATNLLELTGAEINIAAKTGSSMYGKFGWTIVSLGTDAVHGTNVEAMLGFSGQSGAVGWNNGILFSPFNGAFPITSTGSLLATIGNGGGSTVANGIDLSGVTITGCALNIAYGGGAQCAISGNGQLITGGNISLAAGVTQYYFYGPGFAHPALTVVTAPTTTNYVGILSGNTGQAARVVAVGSDTNVNLGLAGQGTGTIQLVSGSSWASNGSVATALTSLGPVGSHTTVQLWITIVDYNGVTRYIPTF